MCNHQYIECRFTLHAVIDLLIMATDLSTAQPIDRCVTATYNSVFYHTVHKRFVRISELKATVSSNDISTLILVKDTVCVLYKAENEVPFLYVEYVWALICTWLKDG